MNIKAKMYTESQNVFGRCMCITVNAFKLKYIFLVMLEQQTEHRSVMEMKYHGSQILKFALAGT